MNRYYKTEELGFLLLIIELYNEQKKLLFLLDPWKTGLKDFDYFDHPINELKIKLGLDKLVINEIHKKQAIDILRENYEISINLDIKIDQNMKTILTKLNVFNFEYNGRLYKCFNCEEGQLNDSQIKEIVKIAKEDLQNNLINTDKETQYYFICSKCESEVKK
tara:strand:+ start:2046 stop:2534 length:489 start_codon:yes stop_codon:yes gene_type:complete